MSAASRSELPSKFLRSETSWEGYKAFHLYKYSGNNLVEEVNSCNPTLVIDAGCGHNRFKGVIKNLVGFDLIPRRNADMCCSILDAPFQEGQADVVLSLGVVHFGQLSQIVENIEKMLSWLKPGGYMVIRGNMHQSRKRFAWDEATVYKVTEMLGVEIFKPPRIEPLTHYRGDGPEFAHVKFNEDEHGNIVYDRGFLKSDRIVWWWKKPGIRKNVFIDPHNHEFHEVEADLPFQHYVNDHSK